MAAESEITRLLERMQSGDPAATDEVVRALYGELRAIAARYLRGERTDHTLQPTALVNEAYLKLLAQPDADYKSRGHFMAVAAMVMRRILVNHAEKRAAIKRGAGAAKVSLDSGALAGPETDIDLVGLDEALNRLAGRDERKARVVEQRFFAGLEMSHIADNLGVSLATVKRDWEFARAWLMRELNPRE